MASWRVIEYAGLTMVQILQRHLALLLPPNSVDVQLASASFFDIYEKPNKPTITLFLYRVIENPEMRNGAQRVLSGGKLQRQPLPLELCYMITAWGVRTQDDPATDRAASAEEHRLLGAVMQAFYDHAEVGRPQLFDTGPSDTVWSANDSLQLVLESPPVEEIFRIWDSTELSYRSSLAYRARVLGLDTLEVETPGRVAVGSFVAGNL